MANNRAPNSHTVQRAATLLRQLQRDCERCCAGFRRQIENPDNDEFIPLTALESVEEAARYLGELGLRPSALRMAKAWKQIFYAYATVILSESSRTASPQFCNNLKKKYGDFPDDLDDEQRQLRIESLYGRAIQLQQLLGELLDALPLDSSADAGTKLTQKRNRKKPGRPGPSREDVEYALEIAEEWERSREARILKPVFAREKGMAVKRLNALLQRAKYWRGKPLPAPAIGG